MDLMTLYEKGLIIAKDLSYAGFMIIKIIYRTKRYC